MKKIFYTLVFVSSVLLALTSCTKEEVRPAQTNNGNGVQIKE